MRVLVLLGSHNALLAGEALDALDGNTEQHRQLLRLPERFEAMPAIAAALKVEVSWLFRNLAALDRAQGQAAIACDLSQALQ